MGQMQLTGLVSPPVLLDFVDVGVVMQYALLSTHASWEQTVEQLVI